jgi:hypothetical protein
MIPISEAYRTKMFDQVQTHALIGTIDGIEFTDADVIGVSYTNRCSDKKVALGSVNIGVLKLTFLKDLLNRGDYYGKVIELSDSLLVGYDEEEDPIWEAVPIGVFYVGEATWTAEGMVDVTAYDCLSKMDIPLAMAQTSGYLYNFCMTIAQHTGTTFGMTQEECEALVNGDALISPYEDNDMTTYRDMVSKLATIVGGFARATRDGNWEIKPFDDTPVLSIGNTRRFSGAKYSDFQTRFDGLSYEDVMTTGETFYIGDPDGFVMEIGNNPFLQYGSPGVVKARVTAIFEQVKKMKYTPFDVSMLPAFCALDLGDVISFTNDYTGNTSTGCIMSLTWTYNKSFKVQCYGSNPNLRSGQSKSDHQSKGAASANKDGRISTYVGMNIQQFNIDTIKQEILRTMFTTSSQQAVLTLTEVKFNLTEPGEVEVYYYLNGEELEYIPKETYSETGAHTLSLMYPLEGLEKDRKYRFVVKMRTSTGLVIEPLSARTYVQGTGFDLTGQFDGYIEVEDEIFLIGFGYLETFTASETVVINDDIEAHSETASDNINFYSIAAMSLGGVSDSVTILLQGELPILCEDEEYLLTEDDQRLLTE